MTITIRFNTTNRKPCEASDLAEASRTYRRLRDESGLGASRFPTATVLGADGVEIGQLSYNGRIWPPGKWTPGRTPLYTP